MRLLILFISAAPNAKCFIWALIVCARPFHGTQQTATHKKLNIYNLKTAAAKEEKKTLQMCLLNDRLNMQNGPKVHY